MCVVCVLQCGFAPIHSAARGSHTACVELLVISRGCDVNEKTQFGETPFLIACLSGSLNVARSVIPLCIAYVGSGNACSWYTCHKRLFNPPHTWCLPFYVQLCCCLIILCVWVVCMLVCVHISYTHTYVLCYIYKLDADSRYVTTHSRNPRAPRIVAPRV